MRKFRIVLIILGTILFLYGFFLNSYFYEIANKNIYNISDNSLSPNKIGLNQENLPLSDNQTQMLFPDRLCVFFNKSEGISVSDNINLYSIIGKDFYYENISGYPDLIDLGSIGVLTLGKIQLREEPAMWLKYMTDNIKSNNISYTISSGYRDISLQEYIFDYKVNTLGEIAAKKLAAKPGFSEHHLGTTVDIITYENNLKLLPTYSKTKLSSWLEKNAYKYGFIQSYPLGKSDETGFSYEPWHYRYIGIDLAAKLFKSKITLYEYLYSQYNYCIVE